MDRNDQILLGSLLAGLLTLLVIVVVDETGPSEAGAAWIQAIFSIAAIGVAIAVPAAISQTDRRERQQLRWQRTCSLATTLVGAIWLLEADMIRVRKTIERHKDIAPDALQWNNWFTEARLNIPDELTNSLPLMYDMLEEIIGPTRQCAMLAMTFNGYIAKFKQVDVASATTQWITLWTQIERQLCFVEEVVKEAQSIIFAADVR